MIFGFSNGCCEGVKDDEDEESRLIIPLIGLVSIWECGVFSGFE